MVMDWPSVTSGYYIEKQMKLGNMIRDQKTNLARNKKVVAQVKKERKEDNHVVALKNKLYDNSALEVSTQRSSFIGGNPNFMSNSMYEQQQNL